MSMHGLHVQIEKFEKFKMDYLNAQHRALSMQSKADVEPTQENLDAARAADEERAAKCREFRKWCIEKRDRIPQFLADSAQEFSGEIERAGWQEFHREIVAHLPALEAGSPAADVPPLGPPPVRPALRTRG